MTSELEEPAASLTRAYAAAVLAKDAGALLDLYDEGVRVFDLWGTWAYDGAEAWRGTVAEWFGSLGDDRSVPTFDDVRQVVADGLAAVHLYVTYTGVSAAGAELRRMVNRLTWVLRRGGDGKWRIVHEHTSAPADPETSKVMLAR